MRYAIVSDANGLVENLVEWDGQAEYALQPGRTFVLASAPAEAGGFWVDGQFQSAPIAAARFAPITARQVRLALSTAGLRDQVEAAVAAADQATQDHWFYSESLHREHPLVVSMAASLGLSAQQIDGLFLQAAQL